MELISVLTLLLGSGLLTGTLKFLCRKLRQNEIKTTALCSGVQALLRYNLLELYDHYTEKGFAPTYARENFENMWRQYHDLGQNGVMDDYYRKFMDLPNKKEEEEEEA